MTQGRRTLAVMTLISALLIACQAGAPGSSAAMSPSAAPSPGASSFAEYAPAFCAAFQALWRGVGNPDTGIGSELSKALDAAMAAGDATAADELATKVKTELEAGRVHAAFAGGWPPAAAMMRDMDRIFIAFEAMADAKATAAKTPGSASPQVVFEEAGGIDAWTAVMTAWPTLADQRPADVPQCEGVPITP
jgi:hypothetical protein